MLVSRRTNAFFAEDGRRAACPAVEGNLMASPPKPSAPHLTPIHSDNTEWEFEAAIERVQRRETTAPRKGFDEQRSSDESIRDGTDENGDDDAPEGEDKAPDEPPPGLWSPFSDEF